MLGVGSRLTTLEVLPCFVHVRNHRYGFSRAVHRFSSTDGFEKRSERWPVQLPFGVLPSLAEALEFSCWSAIPKKQPHNDVQHHNVNKDGPTAIVFMNMEGPVDQDEVPHFLRRLFV